MPTYVYRFVDTGETIEVQQAFTDEPLTEAAHPETGLVMPVRKVFTPVGVTFKGDGFYKTDNRSGAKRSSAASGDKDTSSPSDKASSTTSSSSDSSTSGPSSGTSPSTTTSSPSTS